MIIFHDFHNLFRFLWKCSLCHHQIINLQTHEKENIFKSVRTMRCWKIIPKVKHHFSYVTCRRHLCQRIEMSPKLKSESTSSYCIIRNVNFSLNAPWYWLLAASWPNISIRHDSFEYVMKPVECGSYRIFFFSLLLETRAASFSANYQCTFRTVVMTFSGLVWTFSHDWIFLTRHLTLKGK